MGRQQRVCTDNEVVEIARLTMSALGHKQPLNIISGERLLSATSGQCSDLPDTYLASLNDLFVVVDELAF